MAYGDHRENFARMDTSSTNSKIADKFFMFLVKSIFKGIFKLFKWIFNLVKKGINNSKQTQDD